MAVRQEGVGPKTKDGYLRLTEKEISSLKEVSKYALIYGRGLRDFPLNSQLRFWLWEIGVSGIIAGCAIVYYILHFLSIP